MSKTAGKKRRKAVGRGTPVTLALEIDIYEGAIIIDSLEEAQEVLTMMDSAIKQVKPVDDFIVRAKAAATDYMATHAVPAIQLDGYYYRKITRTSRSFDPRKLKTLVKNKQADGKPLWNFLTIRVPDKTKIDLAVKKGFLKLSTLEKAYTENTGNPYIQPFDGEAMDAEE